MDVPRGQYDISAVHERFAKHLTEGVVVSDLSDPLTIVLRCPPRFMESSGVTVNRQSRSKWRAEDSKPRHGLTGAFELNGLEPGEVMLTIRDANGFLQQKRSVPAPSFDIDAAARIRGHLVDRDTRRAVRPFTITAEVQEKVRSASRGRPSPVKTAHSTCRSCPRETFLIVDAEGYPQAEVSARPIESGQTVENLGQGDDLRAILQRHLRLSTFVAVFPDRWMPNWFLSRRLELRGRSSSCRSFTTNRSLVSIATCITPCRI